MTEFCYYFEGWTYAACAGHWVLRGDPDAGSLDWVEGPLRPEDAILHDLLARIGVPGGEAGHVHR